MSYNQAKALLSKGVSRPTLFSVRLPNRKVSGGTNDYLSFFCRATAIPEVRVNTVAVAGHEFMGVVREQPTAVMFGKPFNMEIIVDKEFNVYEELRGWFDQTALNSAQSLTGARSQRMRYYDTYTEQMELVKLEPSEEGYIEVMSVNFIKAFPIEIGEISLDTEATDTYTSFRVSFSYETYNVNVGSGKFIGAVGF